MNLYQAIEQNHRSQTLSGFDINVACSILKDAASKPPPTLKNGILRISTPQMAVILAYYGNNWMTLSDRDYVEFHNICGRAMEALKIKVAQNDPSRKIVNAIIASEPFI